MSQVIVLGWDALDVELIDEYELNGRFGMHQTAIETFSNEHIGEPHTMELWPSMITGSRPDSHGIYAATGDGGVEWDNPLIDLAATLANGIVSQSILTPLGATLRDRGIGVNQVGVDYYSKNSISTVFDKYTAQPISIPNYRTEYDAAHGLDADRGSLWQALDVKRMGVDGVKPRVEMSHVYDELGSELGRRVGVTLQAIHAGNDIVWTWFGALDSVGHIQPAVNAPLQREFYELAASMTETIRAVAPDDATVVSISDHGLQDGEHTHYATLCSDHPDVTTSIDGVTDLRRWIEDTNPRFEGRKHTSVDEAGAESVAENLEDLGYV